MARAYSRRNSSNEWENVPTVRKIPRVRGRDNPYIDFQFDAGPNNTTRWREVSLELDANDLKQALVQLYGTRQQVIEALLGDMAESGNNETMRADEAEKELAVTQGELAKLREELDKLKTSRAMRVAGGAL